MTSRRAAAAAFLVGFAVMAMELCAVRLLAPHFGDSAYVWTNVIGVMLVALAAGAWFGGRLADRSHGGGRLAGLLVLGAGWTALVPFFASDLGAWLLPQDLALDRAMGALLRGSLVATLVLFAPPVALVGCTTPMLVKLLADRHGRVGGAAGLIAATSTLGSLLGTFATTHVLVPELGSRMTIWTSAALIAVTALLVRARGLAVAGAAGLGLVMFLLPTGPLRPAQPGQELLAEVESSYQYLQVVRETPPGQPAMTLLKINEGLDSFHSVAIDGTGYTGGRYYDYHAVAPFLAGDGQRPEPLRVLSLGAAAGTFARLYAAAHPNCTMDAVEIDPAVVALGDRWFGGRPVPGEVITGLDARVFVECAKGPYDVVLVDAYEHQIYIPAHVASWQFFAAVRRLLRPGGVVSVNVGGRSFDDPVVTAVHWTMHHVFRSAHAFRIPRSRNFVLVSRRDQPLDPGWLEDVRTDDPQLQRIVTAAARGTWRGVSPQRDPAILDDDRPLLDVLQEHSLRAEYGEQALVAMRGDAAPEEVADEVAGLVRVQSYEDALLRLRDAREPTAYLRYLAGDARWLLHDLVGARAEYGAALALGPDPSLRETLDARLADVAELLGEQRRADEVEARNGWLLAAAVLLAAMGLFAGWRVTR